MTTTALDQTKIGVEVKCDACGRTKAPIGRSVPMGMSMCDDDCAGYRQGVRSGSLWPGESEAEFGYPAGSDGVEYR